MKKGLKKRKIYDCTCDSDGVIIEKNLTNIAHLNEKGNVIREEVYNDGEIDILIENTFKMGALFLQNLNIPLKVN
jgi:hypothetical protein